MSRFRSIAPATLVAIAAVAAGMLLARTLLPREGNDAPALASGTLINPPRPLPTLDFVDHRGQPFGLERLKGRWSLLFFGFTHCPDVCPTTLSLLAETEKLLADLPEAGRPQVVLVSVDPKRDTPEKLADYVQFFSRTFTGITAEPGVLDEFTRQMGVPVAIRELGEGQYTVDHSAAIFLVGPDGRLQALFSPPHQAKLLAEDYRRIVESAAHSL
ncbi:MAG TPA: SCO family protein [Steroidobacteraceae bacterium]